MKSRNQEKTQKKLTFIMDSNRKEITPTLKDKYRNTEIVNHQDIFTLQHLRDRIETDRHFTEPNNDNNTTIVALGTNDIKKPNYTKTIENIQEIAKHTNPERTIFVNIPPNNIDTGD